MELNNFKDCFTLELYNSLKMSEEEEWFRLSWAFMNGIKHVNKNDNP